MDEMMSAALELLPPLGKSIEFNAYKAQLYAANPSNGRDVFARLIKQDLINKELSRDANNNIVVLVSRKAAK